MKCRICANTAGNLSLTLKEKMFGTKEEFNYFLCSVCKCIQKSDIPKDLSSYYPENYYAYNPPVKKTIRKKVKMYRNNLLSFLIRDFFEKPLFTVYELSYSDRKKSILDIGAGNGILLRNLSEHGFKHLTGIDPYLNEELKTKKFKLLKQGIQDIKGKFDIVMSHHSLEHMEDPHKFFEVILKLLKTNGRLILRIPIAPNYIWDKFSNDWIQLDAPRHLYTFSLQGIEILCKNAGLLIDKVIYDGEPWSLAATEYCLKGKTYEEFKTNIKIEPQHKIDCEVANQNKNGDSVCLIISKHLHD